MRPPPEQDEIDDLTALLRVITSLEAPQTFIVAGETCTTDEAAVVLRARLVSLETIVKAREDLRLAKKHQGKVRRENAGLFRELERLLHAAASNDTMAMARPGQKRSRARPPPARPGVPLLQLRKGAKRKRR